MADGAGGKHARVALQTHVLGVVVVNGGGGQPVDGAVTGAAGDATVPQALVKGDAVLLVRAAQGAVAVVAAGQIHPRGAALGHQRVHVPVAVGAALAAGQVDAAQHGGVGPWVAGIADRIEVAGACAVRVGAVQGMGQG